LLLQALEKSDWVISKAARMLGISYKTLQYRLEKFEIRKNAKPRPAGSFEACPTLNGVEIEDIDLLTSHKPVE
jgi:hypothetical protein